MKIFFFLDNTAFLFTCTQKCTVFGVCRFCLLHLWSAVFAAGGWKTVPVRTLKAAEKRKNIFFKNASVKMQTCVDKVLMKQLNSLVGSQIQMVYKL